MEKIRVKKNDYKHLNPLKVGELSYETRTDSLNRNFLQNHLASVVLEHDEWIFYVDSKFKQLNQIPEEHLHEKIRVDYNDLKEYLESYVNENTKSVMKSDQDNFKLIKELVTKSTVFEDWEKVKDFIYYDPVNPSDWVITHWNLNFVKKDKEDDIPTIIEIGSNVVKIPPTDGGINQRQTDTRPPNPGPPNPEPPNPEPPDPELPDPEPPYSEPNLLTRIKSYLINNQWLKWLIIMILIILILLLLRECSRSNREVIIEPDEKEYIEIGGSQDSSESGDSPNKGGGSALDDKGGMAHPDQASDADQPESQMKSGIPEDGTMNGPNNGGGSNGGPGEASLPGSAGPGSGSAGRGPSIGLPPEINSKMKSQKATPHRESPGDKRERILEMYYYYESPNYPEGYYLKFEHNDSLYYYGPPEQEQQEISPYSNTKPAIIS